ncbi:hypothetical protein HAX54_015453 [Datura stramonium]|uniref:Uncharacterized protein n=1 Tax=Datura stramonium TaxID=4076 RepID=A0ABS8TQS8_DATST|nr:hypothetical protein [Datura stramonium]
MLESVISHCRLLERLVLEISELLDIIEINAPMLRSFDFKGYISSLCLKNVPLLAKASLIEYLKIEILNNLRVSNGVDTGIQES